MNGPGTARESELAGQLVAAHRSLRPIEGLDAALIPLSIAEAFDIQHHSLGLLNQPIGGWKVGAKALDGPIQGAPLPKDRVLAGGVSLRRTDFAVLGLELEIAFRFGRLFEPSRGLYCEEEVLEALSHVQATIEIVSSRYAQWPAVDKFAQLADLQNHGALVCGEPVPYDKSQPFLHPSASFTFDGQDVVKGRIANPAGDPRRLLAWTVNHCVERGISIGGDVVVTTGSYTGMHFPKSAGKAVGQLAGLPPVVLTLE